MRKYDCKYGAIFLCAVLCMAELHHKIF